MNHMLTAYYNHEAITYMHHSTSTLTDEYAMHSTTDLHSDIHKR